MKWVSTSLPEEAQAGGQKKPPGFPEHSPFDFPFPQFSELENKREAELRIADLLRSGDLSPNNSIVVLDVSEASLNQNQDAIEYYGGCIRLAIEATQPRVKKNGELGKSTKPVTLDFAQKEPYPVLLGTRLDSRGLPKESFYLHLDGHGQGRLERRLLRVIVKNHAGKDEHETQISRRLFQSISQEDVIVVVPAQKTGSSRPGHDDTSEHLGLSKVSDQWFNAVTETNDSLSFSDFASFGSQRDDKDQPNKPPLIRRRPTPRIPESETFSEAALLMPEAEDDEHDLWDDSELVPGHSDFDRLNRGSW